MIEKILSNMLFEDNQIYQKRLTNLCVFYTIIIYFFWGNTEDGVIEAKNSY